MTTSLTPEKKAHIKNIILKILRIHKPTIRFLVKIRGSLVASLPGVKFGRLHYRQLESEKDLALKKNKGNFDATLFLTPAAKNELKWWLENITQSCNWIHPPVIHTVMHLTTHGVQVFNNKKLAAHRTFLNWIFILTLKKCLLFIILFVVS